jgi:hypothetical protein
MMFFTDLLRNDLFVMSFAVLTGLTIGQLRLGRISLGISGILFYGFDYRVFRTRDQQGSSYPESGHICRQRGAFGGRGCGYFRVACHGGIRH